MFVSQALASSEAPATIAAQGGLANLMPFALIMVVVYFFMLRPQLKRQKEHNAMLSSLSKGNKVVTAGGMVGEVTSIDKEKKQVKLKVSDNVEITVLHNSVSQLLGAEQKTAGKPAASKVGSEKTSAKPTTSKLVKKTTKKPTAKK